MYINIHNETEHIFKPITSPNKGSNTNDCTDPQITDDGRTHFQISIDFKIVSIDAKAINKVIVRLKNKQRVILKMLYV